MQEDSPDEFLAWVSLLTQTLCHVRLKDGDLFKPLVTPVLEGLMMCLDIRGSDEELECVAQQVMHAFSENSLEG